MNTSEFVTVRRDGAFTAPMMHAAMNAASHVNAEFGRGTSISSDQLLVLVLAAGYAAMVDAAENMA